MIEASFEGLAERSAAVSGAYQYDTGQRLKMHGLPSPAELAGRDDFLSGDVVTVQAQYAFAGDSQTEMRLAAYDEETGTWTAAVPDRYLMRCADVHVYIYVGYGQTAESMRAKTCYEAVFRPMGRPAPGTEVTPDQKNAWDALMQEINLVIADTGRAASNANAQAVVAKEAADTASAKAEEMEIKMDGLMATQVVVYQLGSHLMEPLVSILDKTTAEGIPYKELQIGIPRGMPGIMSVNGQSVTDGGSLWLRPEDIGAMPADKQTVFEYVSEIPSTSWTSVSYYYTKAVAVPGLLASDTPVVDLHIDTMAMVNKEKVERYQEELAKIVKITTQDGGFTAFALHPLSMSIPVRLMCVR